MVADTNVYKDRESEDTECDCCVTPFDESHGNWLLCVWAERWLIVLAIGKVDVENIVEGSRGKVTAGDHLLLGINDAIEGGDQAGKRDTCASVLGGPTKTEKYHI